MTVSATPAKNGASVCAVARGEHDAAQPHPPLVTVEPQPLRHARRSHVVRLPARIAEHQAVGGPVADEMHDVRPERPHPLHVGRLRAEHHLELDAVRGGHPLDRVRLTVGPHMRQIRVEGLAPITRTRSAAAPPATRAATREDQPAVPPPGRDAVLR